MLTICRPILSLLMAGLIFSLHNQVCAQKINCKVQITLERLPAENQEKLNNLKEELETYINGFDWSEDEFQYEINCELEVAFSEVQVVSYEDRYGANLVISNGVDMLYADKRCSFALQENERLVHSSAYHPFTALIDFYINLLLGYEYDKLYELGGSQYYDLAEHIAISAKSSIQFYKGWDRREELVRDLKSEENNNYRLLLFNYFTGYYFFTENDFEQAQFHLSEAVRLLKSIPPAKLERFFQLNFDNFNQALKKMKMKGDVEILKTFQK